MSRTTVKSKRLIAWCKPSNSFVNSKCGRFQIFPIYGGMTRPESFGLSFTSPHGDRREIGTYFQNQREAKEEAESFYADAPRRYGWRQPNPFDQLTVIRMAIEGHVDNLKERNPDGRVARKAYAALDWLFQQLHDLEPYLRKGAW
jgi:hypothetical protein